MSMENQGGQRERNSDSAHATKRARHQPEQAGRGRGGRGRGGRGRGRSGRGRGRGARHDNQDHHAQVNVPTNRGEAAAGASGDASGQVAAPARAATASPHVPEGRPFLSLHGQVHDATIESLAVSFGYTHMTPVQEAAVPICLAKSDVLVKAKTGTGKTIAFLIPLIERLISTQAPGPGAIRALVLSPTRELASQITREAEGLLRCHRGNGNAVQVMCMVGGVKMAKDARALARRVDLLVATPGRLLDHIQNTNGMAARLKHVQTLVLDEGDQLLDRGFLVDIEKILSAVPPRGERHTYCVSATIPAPLRQVLHVAMREQYATVDCVGSDADTHDGNVVQQSFIVCTHLEHLVPTMWDVMWREMSENPEHKIVVFLPTARQTQWAAECVEQLVRAHDAQNQVRGATLAKQTQIVEIHSRKSQPARERASKQFRESRAAVLLSSDVSARGVDYPSVTLVLQVGAPDSVEQYVHRLGRTARAGRTGRGVLVVMDWEARYFMPLLRGQGRGGARVAVDATDETQTIVGAMLSNGLSGGLSLQAVARASSLVSRQVQAQAYQAMLGFYNSRLRVLGWNKRELVETVNAAASDVLGWSGSQPPALLRRTVGKMGLKGVPGLVLE